MNHTAYKIIPSFQNICVVPEGYQISCLACNDTYVFVGTQDGSLFRFTYEELTDEKNEKYYFYEKSSERVLGQKKRITAISLSSIYGYLLVNVDEALLFLRDDSLEVIPSLSKMRGVTCFHIREGAARDESLSSHVCVGLRRKSVILLAIVEDKLQALCEVTIPGVPIALNFDGSLVCAGLPDRYYITQFEKGEGQEVFSFEPAQVKPIVLHVARGEFLLNGPNALGISTSVGAESRRPPLLLNTNLVDMVMQNPFIVALNDEFITIHSTLQGCEQKQSIPFEQGRALANSGSRLFAASRRQLFAMIPVPWPEQAGELLVRGEVAAALQLCALARRRERDPKRFQEAYNFVLQQAGFVEFERLKFKEARKYFDEGHLHLPELIRLYPNLLGPADVRETASYLHAGVATIGQLTDDGRDAARLRQFRDFLSEFLVEHRESELGRPHRRILDIALLKLYAEVRRPEELEALLELCALAPGDVIDTGSHMASCGRHHAAALLYRQHQLSEEALGIWRRLCEGELKDSAFPGLDFVIEYLTKLSDENLLEGQIDWLIKKNPNKTVTILKGLGAPSCAALQPDAILDRLAEHPNACLAYLEHVVGALKSDSERFHTHLAGLYIERCLAAAPGEAGGLRARTRAFLQSSDLYRVQFVLGKLRDSPLRVETAIVHGKLGDHDLALRILARELSDFEEAKRYCLLYGSSMPLRKKLFENLLAIYLDSSTAESDMLVGPAIDLLNSPDAVFNSAQVLRIVPESWSVSVLSHFLASSLRSALHDRRQTAMRRGLYEGEARRVAADETRVRRRRFDLTAESRCPQCGQGFTDTDCALTPEAGLVHMHCARL